MDLVPTTFEVDGEPRGICIPPEDVDGYYNSSFLDEARPFHKIAEEQPTAKDDGSCYQHARELALNSGGSLRYVDGLAGKSRGITDFGAGPMETYECFPHAWCVNQKGEVVDPGWDAKDDRKYFGVPVPIADVEEHQKDFLSDDRRAKRPILSLPHLKKSAEAKLAAMDEFEAWLADESLRAH